MIFVTLGSHYHPFERLIKAVEELEQPEIVVQHGHSRPPEGVATAVDFMELPELLRHVEEARVVITHSGVGIVLAALEAGHVPVVVPRQRRYREHVDDHQLELARALAEAGRAIALWDVADLADAVAAVPPRERPSTNHTGGPLHSALAATLEDLMANGSRRRSGTVAGRTAERVADAAVGDTYLV